MRNSVLFVLAAIAAVALAGGQYYVPRSYYTIDAEGHASAPVPLRRLRRSAMPNPDEYPGSRSSANADAHASSSGSGHSSAQANAEASSGGWGGQVSPGAGWVMPAGRYIHSGIGGYQYLRN